MSLVGPRPEDPDYVKSYSREQRQVLRVKPGITSPATVLHRHEEQMLTGPDWEETYRNEILPAKLQIELDYLVRPDVSSDLLILAQTASALFAKPKTSRCEQGFTVSDLVKREPPGAPASTSRSPQNIWIDEYLDEKQSDINRYAGIILKRK